MKRQRAVSLSDLGIALRQQGLYSEARKAFEEGLELQGGWTTLSNRLSFSDSSAYWHLTKAY